VRLILQQASISNSGLCVECGASASVVALTSSVSSGVRTMALPVSATGAKVSDPFSVVKIYGGLVVQAQCKGKDLRVHVSASESSSASDFSVPWPHPCPDLMFVDVGANAALRLLLVSPSGAVGYFVNGTARWVRHESLGRCAGSAVTTFAFWSRCRLQGQGRKAIPCISTCRFSVVFCHESGSARGRSRTQRAAHCCAYIFWPSNYPPPPPPLHCSSLPLLNFLCMQGLKPSYNRQFLGLWHSQLHGFSSLVSFPWILNPSFPQCRRRRCSFCSSCC